MSSFTVSDYVLITVAIIGIIAVTLYFLNRKASQKLVEQQAIIDKNKMVQSIFVIDKKKDKLDNVNMPKAIIEQMPKIMKMRKLYFIKAKIGSQIMTLMSEKKVFEALPVKKNVKVELVGIYIMGIVGQKNTEAKNGTNRSNKGAGLFGGLKGKFIK